MKGDFSRLPSRPDKNYSHVLQQQGRVQLDADWNEQATLLVAQGRAVVRALVGPAGGPQGSDEHRRPLTGFRVGTARDMLMASPGMYFVDGILARAARPQRIVYNREMSESGTYVAYLDVWERHVTALDDPDLRESALGGPDTTTRLEVMTHVDLLRIGDLGGDYSCDDFEPPTPTTGTLTAITVPPPVVPDDCAVPPAAQYRGQENQLYRVEIHAAGGDGTATFKWSRDNGTVVARWAGQGGDGGRTLTIEPGFFDDLRGFRAGDWVELTSEERERYSRPGHLVQLDAVEGSQLTVAGETVTVKHGTVGANPKIRRWEGAGTTIVAGKSLPLEHGIEVTFGQGRYHSGDYWLIPARADLLQSGDLPPGGILWPQDGAGEPLAQAPAGVQHVYAPLAICDWDQTTGRWGRIEDCRTLFAPLGTLMQPVPEPEPEKPADCCHHVGDIPSLVATLKKIKKGGTICLGAGDYSVTEPIVVEGSNITVQGCGAQTVITAATGQVVFQLAGDQLALRELQIRGDAAIGLVRADASSQVEIAACHFECKTGLGIQVIDCEDLVIRDNQLNCFAGMGVQGNRIQIKSNTCRQGGILVWEGSEQIRIEDNEIRGGWGAGVWLGGLEPRAEGAYEARYRQALVGLSEERFKAMAAHAMRPRRTKTRRGDEPAPTRRAQVGAHNIGTYMDKLGQLKETVSGIEDIVIANNRITGMAATGIGTVPDQKELGPIRSVTVRDNIIVENGWDADAGLPVPAGIFLDDVEHLQLRGNRIEGNCLKGGCGVILNEILDLTLEQNVIRENGGKPEAGGNDEPGTEGNSPLPQAAVLINEVQAVAGERLGATPALSLRGNQVSAPVGPSIVVTGGGHMSFVDNDFHSGSLQQYSEEELKPTLFRLLSQHILIFNTTPAPEKKTQFLSDAVTQFRHNQSRIDSPENAETAMVYIVCVGDTAITDNQFFAGGNVRTHHLSAFGNSLRVVGNRAQAMSAQASIQVLAAGPMLVELNQTSHGIVTEINGQLQPLTESNQVVG